MDGDRNRYSGRVDRGSGREHSVRSWGSWPSAQNLNKKSAKTGKIFKSKFYCECEYPGKYSGDFLLWSSSVPTIGRLSGFEDNGVVTLAISLRCLLFFQFSVSFRFFGSFCCFCFFQLMILPPSANSKVKNQTIPFCWGFYSLFDAWMPYLWR